MHGTLICVFSMQTEPIVTPGPLYPQYEKKKDKNYILYVIKQSRIIILVNFNQMDIYQG